MVDNIVLGNEPRKRPFLYDRRKALAQVEEVCETYKLQADLNALVSGISLAMKQRVEIIKTLYRKADILILDEPTAVLTPQDIEELGQVLRQLKSLGKTIIIITHKIEEVMNFSDRVTVLRQGKKVGTVITKETNPQEITRLMVGKEVALGGEKKEALKNDPLLAFENVGLKGVLQDISFTMKQGEILGVAGIDGSGQTEIGELICGVRQPEQGNIYYEGKEISGLTVRQRKELGLAYIPQDRHRHGLVLPFNTAENLILGFHRRKAYRTRKGFLNDRAIVDNAKAKITRFDIRPPEVSQSGADFSGGNQQKIIIAREVGSDPVLLVADQPTRGVDIGAIEFIHSTIVDKRNNGCAVLLISLELDEVLMLSDRVMVVHEGKIMGIVDPKGTTREEIGLMMLGQKGGRNDEAQ